MRWRRARPGPTGGPLNEVVQQLRRLALSGAGEDVTDGALMQRFLAQGEEDAFAALVQRHGPMVLGVCRRVLGNAHDAEDAFTSSSHFRPRACVVEDGEGCAAGDGPDLAHCCCGAVGRQEFFTVPEKLDARSYLSLSLSKIGSSGIGTQAR